MCKQLSYGWRNPALNSAEIVKSALVDGRARLQTQTQSNSCYDLLEWRLGGYGSNSAQHSLRRALDVELGRARPGHLRGC
jgi:hypothetical protein